MYGLPIDFDASIFVGKELMELCFTANTIHLVFENEISVTLLGSFSFARSSNDTPVSERVPVESSALVAAVGRRVEHAAGQSDGSLTLSFEGGRVLVCLDDSREYESYQVHAGGREIIV